MYIHYMEACKWKRILSDCITTTPGYRQTCTDVVSNTKPKEKNLVL